MGGGSSKPIKKTRQQRIMDQLYLDKETTGDVTFIVESKKIRAHKCVLAAISPKYHAQFYGLQRDEGEIIVQDVTTVEFEEFLRFFYLDEINLTADNVEGVLNLVKQSLVDEFVNECGKYLGQSLLDEDSNSQWLVYRLANSYHLQEVIDVCLLFISTASSEFFTTDEFLDNCSRDMLLQIVKLDSLNCKETEVFDICISWAKCVCNRKNIEDKTENLRAELGDIIYEVRFRSMTFEEFANLHRSCEGFFTPEEVMEIMYMVGNVTDFVPKHFNPNLRDEIDIAIDMELNRLVLKEEADYKMIRIVPVTFSCDKAIYFKGFATGFQLANDQYELLVITERDGKKSSSSQKYAIRPLQNETIVTFETPIDIRANENVRVSLVLPTLESSTKYTLTQAAECDNVKFSFNADEGHAPGILITRLYFCRNVKAIMSETFNAMKMFNDLCR
ncbi:hypothetical protein HA402_002683 [Bradysia odoriphaga]|nr:hypothetical protein HA402_002683 [Bradysia odoriphaga]